MKKTRINVSQFVPRASRRERALPLIEILKDALKKRDIVELDFSALEDIQVPFLDQIIASTAGQELDRIVFIFKQQFPLEHLKFISKHRQLQAKYRLKNKTRVLEVNEPPPPPEPKPIEADITELPPSPWDPNPKKPL